MKKILLFIAAIISCSCIYAQSFLVSQSWGNEWHNDTEGYGSFQKNEEGQFWLNITNTDRGGFGFAIDYDTKLFFHPAFFGNRSRSIRRILACQPAGDIIEVPIIGNSDVEVTFEGLPDYMHRLPDEVKDGNLTVKLQVDANSSSSGRRDVFSVFLNGLKYKIYIVQPESSAPSFDEQKNALRKLYDATQGNSWDDNTNWFSDKPINQWHGINNDPWGQDSIIGNYILKIRLNENNLKGELPPETSILLPTESTIVKNEYADIEDFTWGFDIALNHIYGIIPKEIKSHPSWDKVGWYNILQFNYAPKYGMFNWNDYNLQTGDSQFTYFLDKSKGSLKEILAKNEYTLVFDAGVNDEILDIFWDGISDKRINLFLDYYKKGLGMIACVSTVEGYSGESGIEYVKEKLAQGMPKEIIWADIDKNGFDNINLSLVGTVYLIDKNGNLLQVWAGDECNKDWSLEDISEFLHENLGEPDIHDTYYSNYYTSTDYSKDGEVLCLQKASVGSGIDIVFLGEGFVDLDMEENGLYEQVMYNAMEQFFSEEPYNSLRDRFNIYAVKCVSPNGVYDTGTTLAIGGSVEKAFEYAQKAVGDRDDRLMVGVICKENAIAGRSVTFMFQEDGSFAAWMFEGVNSVLNHEMGGHGVTLLLDEYVEYGMEEMSPNDEEKTRLDNLFAKYGEGANVDWRSNPLEVKWEHFLNDSRYSVEGLGVYEGGWLYGHGIYRPTLNSMMRYNNTGFNAPSREAIYKRVMKLSEGDSWTYDYDKFVEFDTPARESYRKQQSAARRAQGQNVKKRLIESRPPTIYKGTWRDAGKCEKVDYSDFNK